MVLLYACKASKRLVRASKRKQNSFRWEDTTLLPLSRCLATPCWMGQGLQSLLCTLSLSFWPLELHAFHSWAPKWCWNVTSHFHFFPENAVFQAQTRPDAENGLPEWEGYIKSYCMQLLFSSLLIKHFSQGSPSNSEYRSRTCRE